MPKENNSSRIELLKEIKKINPLFDLISDALPAWFTFAMEGYMIQTGAPMMFVLPLMLALWATACQKHYDIQLLDKNDVSPLSLYFILVGPPGSGKSRAFKRIMKPLIDYKKSLTKKNHEEEFEKKVGDKILDLEIKKILSALFDAMKLGKDDPNLRDKLAELLMLKDERQRFTDPMLSGDTTAAALKRNLAGEGVSTCIMSDELKSLFEHDLLDTGASLLLSGFDGFNNGLSINRANERFHINNARLSICFLGQNHILETEFKKKRFDPYKTGLASRFFYAQVKNKTHFYKNSSLSKTQLDSMQMFEKEVSFYLKTPAPTQKDKSIKRYVLKPSKEALVRLLDIQEEIAKNPRFDGLEEFNVRFFDMVLRLSGLLHLLDKSSCRTPIDINFVEDAFVIAQVFMSEVTKMFSFIALSDYAKLGQWFGNQLRNKPSVTLSEVSWYGPNAFRHNTAKRDEIIKLLLEDQVIKVEDVNGTTTYFAGPRLSSILQTKSDHAIPYNQDKAEMIEKLAESYGLDKSLLVDEDGELLKPIVLLNLKEKLEKEKQKILDPSIINNTPPVRQLTL